MAEVNDRLRGEFRRMDDELSSGVALPSIDSVVRRTGTVNRVTTAAAAAVFTVGSLGTITAVAQAGTSVPAFDTSNAAADLVPAPAAVPGPSEGEQERAAAATTTTPPPTTTRRVIVKPKPKITTTRPKPTVVVPLTPTVVPVPTTVKPKPTTPPPDTGTDEGTPDPTTSNNGGGGTGGDTPTASPKPSSGKATN